MVYDSNVILSVYATSVIFMHCICLSVHFCVYLLCQTCFYFSAEMCVGVIVRGKHVSYILHGAD